MSSAKVPVLVGIGVATRREEDPARALEPIALMLEAVRTAIDDAGSPALPAAIGRILVPKGRWSYANPAGMIGRAIGSERAVTVLATPGVPQQSLIADACRRIASGEIAAALVVGGDAGYRILRGQVTGVPLVDTTDEEQPDVFWAPHAELRHEVERRAGLIMPAGLYAIMESALRHAQGDAGEGGRMASAELMSRFTAVAAANPHAWRRDRLTAQEIRTPSPKNPMQAFPYTRLQCSSWNVDQAGALLFTSTETAAALGITPGRWLYPISSSESNHMVPVTARARLSACPGARIAGRAALDAAGLSIDEVDLVDLYSCFPIAVELYAAELGLPLTRDLTVTGGMPFAGGPYNNYVFQSTCRMAELLRAGAGRVGLVSTVSGVLTKQAFGIWSRQPGRRGFVFEDCTDAVAREIETRPVVDPDGTGAIAGFTVLHDRGKPPRAIAVIDLDGGTRTAAISEDAAIIASLESVDGCERVVAVTDGTFAFG